MGFWHHLLCERGGAKQPKRTEEETIERDLTAQPISQTRMDLLWLSESSIRLIETSIRASRKDAHVVAGSSADAVSTNATLEDIAWVNEVYAAVDGATEAVGRKDFRRAIRLYREALELAPGCDQWLNSIGSCYAMMGSPAIGVRYVQRAHEVTTQKARIASNLEGIRDML